MNIVAYQKPMFIADSSLYFELKCFRKAG